MWKELLETYGQILIAAFVLAMIYLAFILITKKDVFNTLGFNIFLIVIGLVNVFIGVMGIVMLR